MKKTALMLAAIIMMAICLPSCGGNDDDNNNSNNTNPTETEVETISLKYLRSFLSMTKAQAQDTILSKGYVSLKDTTYDGVNIYTYIKVNTSHDTTVFGVMCYSTYILASVYMTSNSSNSKLLTAFKSWSNEMYSWSNQYSNANYQGTINDSTYNTHSTFLENLNIMDISLINQADEGFIPSQTNMVTATYMDRDFDINSMLNDQKSMRKTNPKMVGLMTIDASSVMGKSQAHKVCRIMRNMFK